MKKMNDEEAGLNAAQKARMEKNRLRALTLRDLKVIPRPSANIDTGGALRDTGGGFLLEDSPPRASVRPASPAPAPASPCEECGAAFPDSFLWDSFGLPVCDPCRHPERHSLLTKTEAKAAFLLQDCHLERVEPALRFVSRRNPHRPRGAPMRLYLRAQLEERALQVWDGAAGLAAERERRAGRGEAARAGRLRREVRALRQGTRPAGQLRAGCQHSWEETALGEDRYRGLCTLCGQVAEYEKM